MWTRLVAGAAAHDINNLAQGLANLLSLATAPTATNESLERYAALARDGLKELRQLATDLRALAGTGGPVEIHQLDLLAVEAVSDIETPRDRSIDVSPLEPGVVVAGSGPALRLAIEAVVRYAVAASAPRGTVGVSVVGAAAMAAVVVIAPTAPTPRAAAEGDLAELLAGADREFGGDAGLVLAGAATHLSGGRATAGPASSGGVQFKLSFPRAEKGNENEGPLNASHS
jgi:two-component system, OmpR family, sensor histidine kinase PrrB